MTGDAELVKMILNHKSAEEDMLLSQSSLGKDKDNNKQQPPATKKDTTDNSPADAAGEAAAAHDSALPDNPSDSQADSKPSGGGKAPGEDDDGPSITHELGFGGAGHSAEPAEAGVRRGLSFLVRELPIRNPDECFGDDPEEDTTGLCLWGASVVLARWVASPELQERLGGKSVLELGAGCGAG